jgi:hypothetical protein
LKRRRDFAIQVSPPKQFKQMKLIKPRFITSDLVGYENVYIQLSEMYVNYNIPLIDAMTNQSIKSNGSVKVPCQTLMNNDKNVCWLNNIDEAIAIQSMQFTRHAAKVNLKSITLEELKDYYMPSFKKRSRLRGMYDYQYDEVDQPDQIKLKVVNIDKPIVYLHGKTSEKFSVRHAIEHKYLGIGAR